MSELFDKRLLDDAFDAYIDWREDSAEVWEAYERWLAARRNNSGPAFSAYQDALDREERASQVYARLVAQLMKPVRVVGSRSATG